MTIGKRLASLEKRDAPKFGRFESSFMRDFCIARGTDPDKVPEIWAGYTQKEIQDELMQAVMDAANEHS